MLGHLASLLPLGALPFRVNLTACAYHAVAVGITYATAFVMTGRRVAAIFAAAMLAFVSPIFVSWSLQAEVFSLNDLFAAAIVFFCVLMLGYAPRWKLVVPVAALFGLGLSSHQSLILLAPLPLWPLYCSRAAIVARWRDAAGVFALAAAIAFLGFALPYAHTLLVSQHLAHWQFGSARTLDELRDLIGRRAYGGFNLVPHATDRGGSMASRLLAMVQAQGAPLWFALAGAIIAGLMRRRDAVLALLAVAFPMLAFCAVSGIAVGDDLLRAVFQRFALLPLVALAPFSAFTFVAFESLAARTPARKLFAPAVLLVTLGFAIPALAHASLSGERGPRALYRDIFSALPRNAILVTAGDPVDQPPQYFQAVEAARPDVTVVTFGLLDYPPYVEALRGVLHVPAETALPLAPAIRRDALANANRDRPLFVTGERPIHAPGPLYAPSVTGIVSQMVRQPQHLDLARHYRDEAALQSAPGYAEIGPDRWKTNGFGTTVREYYAGGFFSTGLDAERLGAAVLAIAWYERAREYFDDPIIGARLNALRQR